MARILGIRSLVDPVQSVAERYRVKPKTFFSYLLLEHNLGLTEASADLYRYMNDTNRTHVRTMEVTNSACLWVRDAALEYDLRVPAVVGIVFQDNLPMLQGNPDLYPWIAQLANAPQRRHATGVVQISSETYRRIKLRTALYAASYADDRPLSVSEYIAATLSGLPTTEFINAAKLNTDFLSTVGEEIRQRGGQRNSVRIPWDIAVELEDMRQLTGVGKGTIVDFLLSRDLDATQEEITLDRNALPSEMRARWIALLGGMMSELRIEDED